MEQWNRVISPPKQNKIFVQRGSLVFDLSIKKKNFFFSGEWPKPRFTSSIINKKSLIRKYRTDCNNNPPNAISFMSAITSTSGRVHSEFVRLLFLQDHRETDRFFTVLGVQIPQHHRDHFHYRRGGFDWLTGVFIDTQTFSVPTSVHKTLISGWNRSSYCSR